MRLGTCIALELAIAASAVSGVWLVASHARLPSGYLQSEAIAATTTAPRPTLAPLERGDLAVAPPAPHNVFGAPDGDLLAPLAATPIQRVKLNHGGSSLSFRIEFRSGARAAFKPLQVHPQTEPRREIAAFRVDRLLGIGRVPPAKSAVFAVEDVIAGFDPSARAYAASRIEDEAIVKDGKLYGELSWWIPEIKRARIDGKPIDEPDGQAAWTAYLQAGAARPADRVEMLAQLATVILFDVLIDNSDRWSGNNTQGSPDQRVLYFMDNTLAFSHYTLGHAVNLSKLYRIQVFPRSFVGRLRALTAEAIAAAIGGEDELLGALLTETEIRATMSRRDHLLEYVDRQIAAFGEDKVLALP